ncbi:MAG: hypothetical protein EXQ84_06425 [Rhodospirillaceae bacterium]|nr:hypothetical protein [Rhodospirillaceae bacterium]
MRAAEFDRVYDFACSPHSRRLFWLMYGWQALPFNRAAIPWSGTIPGTALLHDEPRRPAMHLIDRWNAQLRAAGVYGALRTDISWVARQVKTFNLPFRMSKPFVLISLDPGPGTI